MKRALAVALLLAAGCKKEPAGTPVTPAEPGTTKGDQYSAWAKLATASEKEGKWDEALYARNQAIELAKQCLLDETDDCKQFLEKHNRIGMEEIFHVGVWKMSLRDDFTGKARALNQLGQPKFALKAAEEAIAQRDDFHFAYAEKGDAYFRLGKFQECHDAFLSAKGQKGGNPHVYAVRAGECMLKLGKKDEAKKLVEEGIQIANGYKKLVVPLPENLEELKTELEIR